MSNIWGLIKGERASTFLGFTLSSVTDMLGCWANQPACVCLAYQPVKKHNDTFSNLTVCGKFELECAQCFWRSL